MEFTFLFMHQWAVGIVFGFYGSLYPWIWEILCELLDKLANRTIKDKDQGQQ